MTLEEIKDKVKKGNGTLDFELYSDAFCVEIKQNIYIPTLDWKTGEQEQDINKLVTPYIVECVNSFLTLNINDFKEQLQDEFYRLFNIYIEVTSYGQVPDELIEKCGNTEANRIFFKGDNKESVFEQCRFEYVFYDNDTGPEIRFNIHVGIDWDQEHGINLFFENGLLVNIET